MGKPDFPLQILQDSYSLQVAGNIARSCTNNSGDSVPQNLPTQGTFIKFNF